MTSAEQKHKEDHVMKIMSFKATFGSSLFNILSYIIYYICDSTENYSNRHRSLNISMFFSSYST